MGFTWDLWDETKKSHLKMDGWNTIVSFWEWPIFRGELLVSGRVFVDFYPQCFFSEDELRRRIYFQMG